METLFRVVAASQWEQALATGWVPRCPADERRDRVHLNECKDVERVAGLWFSPDEQPVALELDVTSVASSLCWDPRDEEPFETWPNLHIRNIPVGIVVAVHCCGPILRAGFAAGKIAWCVRRSRSRNRQ